ncbi:hypothetical protein NX784_25815 [Massilia pinisoli]|uniref:FecR family protein n=1 Tax=Massilia pinisoli TaxID=1772194 RepID=A0ABT1ZYP0_9BURK|nr:DUF6600 domain-containing protein [Massilia pinisoli]MCS0585010.1 hypothetical protein [Massilia pinisoli]
MSNRAAKTAVLLAFSTLTALAVAADPPARVGRVALAQGQVAIGSDVGAEMTAAQVNWPVTSGNTISTAAGSRTELRVGSTSIRLDGDSSLEVLQMDDDALRLRLHYGSASVRVLNPDVLAGFELETPQARVRLTQPGRVRVDAERVRDTSAVTVFDGVALVEDGNSQLTLRAGRRAELGDDDVRTLAAVRDQFDDWSATRDRYADNAASVRYVTSEMTGYEDLDRYGNWREDAEYGAVWYPAVSSTWVPYRDGSWTWLEPWGWTWVDNAPWGYAPFHYGRWVTVHNRWAWVPGRRHEHLVWAPALVGWVGGDGWNVVFRDRGSRPATGWYPLSPHDRFVPTWHAPDNHRRWLNEYARDNPQHSHGYRPQGLTVVPQDRFGQPGRVPVSHSAIVTAPPVLAQNVAAGAPPARPGWINRDRDGSRGPVGIARQDGHDRRLETDRADRADRGRDGFLRQRQQAQVLTAPPVMQTAQGLPVTSPTPHLPQQPLSTVTSPTPHQSPQPLTTASPVIQQQQAQPPAGVPGGWRRDRMDRDERRDERREQMDEWRRNRQLAQPTQPIQAAQPAQPQTMMTAPAAPPQQAMQQPIPQQRFERPRFERPEPRIERTEARIERPAPPPVQMAAPPAAVAPRPVPAAAPAPAPAAKAPEERRQRADERGRRQQQDR